MSKPGLRLTVAASAGALLATLLGGCGSVPPGVGAGAASPDGPSSAAKTLSTPDGLVTVTPPSEGEWDCQHDSAATAAVTARWILCRLANSAPLFFLMAKDYTVPREDIMPPGELFARHYERNYERMYTSFFYLQRGPVDHHGHPAHEVTLEAVSPVDGEVIMRERAMVVREHVLLLTASAGPDAFERAQAVVQHWFDSTRFATLDRFGTARTARRSR